jgi:HEAT repeat protein
MNELEFHSLDDIKRAFQISPYDAKTIMKDAIPFLRRAVEQGDECVRQFLIDFAKTPTTSFEERFAVARAITLLKHYQDPDLLPFFVQMLSVDGGYYQHETILALVKLRDLRAAAPLAALLEEDDNSPRDVDFLLNALASTRALEYLDVMASYLSHDNNIIRVGGITSLLYLGSVTGRKEVVDMVMPYLQDPEQYVRIKTAYHINMRFAHEFYDRGLEGYLPEGLHFPRPQQEKTDSPERARNVARPSMQMAYAGAA